MRPFSFLHAADLHLDTPFTGIGRVSPLLRERLRDATLAAFDRLVRLALDQKVAFVVLAGDIYDGPERGLRAAARLAEGLAALDAHGIASFLALGNHDPVGAKAKDAFGVLPPLAKLFGERVETFPVTRDGEPLCLVHGISYARRDVTENLAARFRRDPRPLFQVGVLHGTVGSHPGLDPYSPTDLETLVASGLDYWALGHVHTRAVLRESAPAVVYPGNLQALSPREPRPRGAYLVRVDEEGTPSLEFHPLDEVRFARVEADAGAFADFTALRRHLSARAAEERERAGERPLLLRAVLTGRTPLHHTLSRLDQREEFLQSLQDAEEGSALPVQWLSLEDATASPIDEAALREQDGLPAAVLAQVDRLAADAPALAALAEEAWEDFSSHDRTFPPPSPDEFAALLADARQWIVERLLGEEPS